MELIGVNFQGHVLPKIGIEGSEKRLLFRRILDFLRISNLQPKIGRFRIRVLHQFLGASFQNRSTVFEDIPMMDDW